MYRNVKSRLRIFLEFVFLNTSEPRSPSLKRVTVQVIAQTIFILLSHSVNSLRWKCTRVTSGNRLPVASTRIQRRLSESFFLEFRGIKQEKLSNEPNLYLLFIYIRKLRS